MNRKRKINIPDEVQEDLRSLCEQYHVRRMILFGSRAREDNLPKSDIDLAIEGCRDFTDLAYDIDNRTRTLLQFDLVNLDCPVSEKLLEQIQRDGVELFSSYEDFLNE